MLLFPRTIYRGRQGDIVKKGLRWVVVSKQDLEVAVECTEVMMEEM